MHRADETHVSVLDAFHLPGLDLAGAEFDVLDFGTVRLRYPRLDAGHVERLARSLAAARTAFLADLPVREVVAAIDRTAARFQDTADPYRMIAERALPAGTPDWLRAQDVAMQARAELERERDRN